jgi:predicted dehydrogenase
MTLNLAEAEELLTVVKQTGIVFGLTHTYTGYPLVRQAREMVLAGELGEIDAIRSHYYQGWLRTRIEADGQKQASWRTDPARSGAAGCYGDIGTHAYNLGRYITGLMPAEMSTHLKIFAPGRQLDDYGHSMIRYENGALGTVTASQISHGRENDVWIAIDGTKRSLEWHQENPNVMFVYENGEPLKQYTRSPGARFMTETANAACRIPSGHPEGYFEAFANLYRAAFDDMALRAMDKPFESKNTIYTNVYDGVEGMFFIEQSVASSADNGAWLPMKHPAART